MTSEPRAAVTAADSALEAIGRILRDRSKPMKQRFRALFTLRGIGGATAVDLIAGPLLDADESSALLKHELAYCLGQMRDERAIPVLVEVLGDDGQHPMVRHEAGEALGAIGSPDVLEILERHRSDSVVEVAETCQLAIQRIRDLQNVTTEKSTSSIYDTVDPAFTLDSVRDVQTLRSILLDDKENLYSRYGAMFALRDIGTDDATAAICEALFVGSSLFKHEVAFVLGQLQKPTSVPSLIRALRDMSENEMVRHECAEALGSVATPECSQVLNECLRDPVRVVRESCEVALDMCDYENDAAALQYANCLHPAVSP